MEDSVSGVMATAAAKGSTVLVSYGITSTENHIIILVERDLYRLSNPTLQMNGDMQLYCKEKLVCSRGLNPRGIKAIYWFIGSMYLTCDQWTVHFQIWNQRHIR